MSPLPYLLGKDLRSGGPDIDLDVENVFDSHGNRIDQAYVEQAVAAVHQQLHRGRPSLTEEERSRRSPQLSIKFPASLKAAADARAKQEGRTVSELVREAVAQYLHTHAA